MSYLNNTLTKTNISLLLLVAFLFIGISTAFAATNHATTNEGFTQGLQKDGGLVDILRSDPTHALGATDGEFVTLGYGGELIVGFDQNMSGNLQLAVQEVTGAEYPLETADVYVSTEATGPWTLVGEATNEEGLGDGATSFAVAECFQYVRVIDTTDGNLHDDSSDGFDIDSFAADYDETCPVVEPEHESEKMSRVHISLHNAAMIVNETNAAANTGGNSADGSYGGSGGDAGSIENNSGEQDVEGATTGSGGSGGSGAFGGAVQTGNALADTSVSNDVNGTVVRVSDCACEEAIGRVHVRTNNFALLGNRTMTAANSGDNDALGSYAGDGGEGGDIENGGSGHDNEHEGPEALNNKEGNGHEGNHGGDQEIDDSTTGSGGSGGSASDGGSILTGQATSRVAIVNLVNNSLIRVR